MPSEHVLTWPTRTTHWPENCSMQPLFHAGESFLTSTRYCSFNHIHIDIQQRKKTITNKYVHFFYRRSSLRH